MSSSPSPPEPQPIRIGVFLPNGAQFLDVACVDSLGVMSRTYLRSIPFLPAAAQQLAPEVSVCYVGAPGRPDIPLTSGAVLRATHSYADAAVAPGSLDVVVVPGPDPADDFDPDALRWLRAHHGQRGVDVLSICTGLFVCAAAGIADGREASGPRWLQGVLRERFPEVKLSGERLRWTRDGNFWSSGGVTNGNELVAAYARACGRWPRPVVELGLMLTEVGDQGQFYPDNAKVQDCFHEDFWNVDGPVAKV